MGVWKVNVDVACKDGGKSGFGIIICNDAGQVVVSRCLRGAASFNAELAEGIACQEGLALAREYGGRKIVLETDCQSVFHRLQSDKDDISYIGEVCNSVKTEAAYFESVILYWARRTANSIDHDLAVLERSFS